MMIRSATSLRNGYDEMVRLAKEKQEPIYLTRNGDGEMVLSRWISGRSGRKSLTFCICCCSGNNPDWREQKPPLWTIWSA